MQIPFNSIFGLIESLPDRLNRNWIERLQEGSRYLSYRNCLDHCRKAGSTRIYVRNYTQEIRD